ncbi:hypothetical protein R6Z07F_001190 [Ovis aries]
MVSVCLPSDALLQHLPSSLGFSYLGFGVSLHGCSSKAQLLLLTLDKGYLLTATPPDLERGIAPLDPPAPAQPLLLGCGVAPPGRHPWPPAWGSSSRPLLSRLSLALIAATPDLGRGVAPLGHASARAIIQSFRGEIIQAAGQEVLKNSPLKRHPGPNSWNLWM